MRRSRIRAAFVFAVVALVVGAVVPSASSTSKPTTATADPLAVLRSTANDIGMGDPDLPPVGSHIDPATYLALRSGQTAMYRGAPFTLPYNGRRRRSSGSGSSSPTGSRWARRGRPSAPCRSRTARPRPPTP